MEIMTTMIIVHHLIIMGPALVILSVWLYRIGRADKQQKRLLREGKLVEWPRHEAPGAAA